MRFELTICLLAQDYETAQNLARELNQINRERQQLTRKVQEAARNLALASGKDQQRIAVIAAEEFPAGWSGW
jgi:single-stranded-DNA-specific exonuclease